MTFNSVEYFAFLTACLALYWAAHPKLRPWVLLISSYLFYATWDWRFVPLLVFSTVLSFMVGRALPTASESRKRHLLWLAVGCTAGIVAGFKTVNLLLGGTTGAGGIGLGIGTPGIVEAVIIPIGLSFYSFQVISYVIDVKRGVTEPERSFVVYAVYVAFFPHLLAGPIVRAHRLIPQLRNRRKRPDPVAFTEGLQLILIGLFKKVAIADPLVRTVRPIIGSYLQNDPKIGISTYLISEVVIIIANYFDICGYIDIARGSAKLFGIRMPPSFAQPLTRSRDWTEFWRRWQITIMGWFRDYVYGPLRGSTRSDGREYLALMGTFLAAGIWHGLAPGWLIWGALTGGILVLERKTGFATLTRRRRRDATVRQKVTKRALVSLYLYMCLLVTTPWAAGGTIPMTAEFFTRWFTTGVGSFDINLVAFAIYGVVLLVALDWFERRMIDREGFRDPVTPWRSVVYGGMIVALLVFSGTTSEQFIYFQF